MRRRRIHHGNDNTTQPKRISRKRWQSPARFYSRRLAGAETQAPRSSSPGDPHAPLQPEDRGNLRSLDQAVYLFSQQASSRRNGRSGDSSVSFQLGNRIKGERLHVEPSAERAAVSLSPRLGQRDRLCEWRGSRQQAEAATDGLDTTGSEVYFREPRWFGMDHGHDALWSGPSTDGMPAGQG